MEKLLLEAINLAASFSSAIIMIVIFFGALSMGNRDQKIYRYFLYLVISNLCGAICESAGWVIFMSGKTADYAFIRQILEVISYSVAGIQLIFFSLYFLEFLSAREKISKTLFYIAAASGVVNIVLLVISQFNGMYFAFDEFGNYIQQDGVWISQITVYFNLLIWLIAILKNRKMMSKNELVSILIYLALPLVTRIFTALPSSGQELWLYSLACSVVLLILFVNIQLDLRRQSEIKEKNSEMLLLLRQIQPHFLFNSLAAIRELCVEDPARAEEAIISFSNYLRGNMDALSTKRMISFENELEHVEQYIWLEKLKFEDMIEVEYEIGVSDFVLPPLTLEPIVENAVRHGVTKKKGGGRIKIKTEKDEKNIVISVEDNGAGFDMNNMYKQDGRSHIGIDNVQERLKTIMGGEILFESEMGKGTLVTIKIPEKGGEKSEYNSGR